MGGSRILAPALALATLLAGCTQVEDPPTPENPGPTEVAADVGGVHHAPIVDPPPPECPPGPGCKRHETEPLPENEQFEKGIRLGPGDDGGTLDFSPRFPWQPHRILAWTITSGSGALDARTLSLYRPESLLVGRAEGVGRLEIRANGTPEEGDATPYRLAFSAATPVASDERVTLVAEIEYFERDLAWADRVDGDGFVASGAATDDDLAVGNDLASFHLRVRVVDQRWTVPPSTTFTLLGPDGETAATLGRWGGEVTIEAPRAGVWTLRATRGLDDPFAGFNYAFTFTGWREALEYEAVTPLAA